MGKQINLLTASTETPAPCLYRRNASNRKSPTLSGVSFNQPKFCPNATWDSSATTFAYNNTIGRNPYGIFISNNNTVYVANRQYGRIHVWSQGNISSMITIITNSSIPWSVFVSSAGDIYLSNSWNPNYLHVDVWRMNPSTYVNALQMGDQCYSLFLDTNGSLYCSAFTSHRVIKRSVNSSDTQITVVAGTLYPGFLDNMLNIPWGIFVTTSLDLYVADCNNNRVQLFQSGQMNGTTVAGGEAMGTIVLNHPRGLVLDADGYLFIVDSDRNRILASGPNGFRCLASCNVASGAGPHQFHVPYSMAFDSYGNYFVVDNSNHRVQKFLLTSNSCSKCYSLQTLKTETLSSRKLY